MKNFGIYLKIGGFIGITADSYDTSQPDYVFRKGNEQVAVFKISEVIGVVDTSVITSE